MPVLVILFFLIKIAIFHINDTPQVLQNEFESKYLNYANKQYYIKTEKKDSEIYTSNFTWQFKTSTLKNKSINLTIETTKKEIKYAMDRLESLYNLTEDDLGITSDYNKDPENFSRQYWGAIYKKLSEETSFQTNNIAINLNKIAQNEKLNNNDLLLLCITLVQNIQYKIPTNDMGILPPIVSISERYGDCDTTSLLLHSILKKLGYETVLYYSREYRHAMLGINTNATGNFKTLNGIPYYFLEVTSSGWNIGQISPEMNNLDKWIIIPL